jgi:hypothetical protein
MADHLFSAISKTAASIPKPSPSKPATPASAPESSIEVTFTQQVNGKDKKSELEVSVIFLGDKPPMTVLPGDALHSAIAMAEKEPYTSKGSESDPQDRLGNALSQLV